MAVPEKVLEGIIAQILVGRLGKAEEIAKCVASSRVMMLGSSPVRQ